MVPTWQSVRQLLLDSTGASCVSGHSRFVHTTGIRRNVRAALAILRLTLAIAAAAVLWTVAAILAELVGAEAVTTALTGQVAVVLDGAACGISIKRPRTL